MAKNTRNKFMVGAVTAAMVATAVAPVAGAQEVKPNADVSYSDVSPTSSHFPFIYKALDYKIMTGYADNSFKPTKKMTRGQVVKSLGKYVVAKSGKPLSEFDVTNVKPFNDVPSSIKDQELYMYSLIVKQAGIFSGDNNNLKASNLITREQMSKVLVNAFDLKDLPGDLSKVTDNNTAQSQYRGYIDILSENGVTSESLFRPKENTSRAQFATFLVRAYELANGVPVDPPVIDPGPIVNDHTLDVTFGKASLVANGADNTAVTFTVKNKDGQVATNADNIVLEVTTSHGSLASERVTVQDGKATVLLTSEFSQEALKATVQGKLIEAAADSPWHKEIGNLVATGTINFTPISSTVDATTVPSLLKAETNEADRVTLYFDKAVTPAMYLKVVNGKYVTDGEENVVFKEGSQLSVGQNGEPTQTIRGLKSVAGNPNALEVVLDVVGEAANPALTPNASVFVESGFVDFFGETLDFSTKTFTFTDARSPELASVETDSLRDFTLVFSEPVTSDYAANAKITVDGQPVSIVADGEFYQNGSDSRHEITVRTTGFLKAGKHSVQVSGVEDYAGNVISNETLDFTIPVNNTAPSATVAVESPEQVRLTWNHEVAGFTTDEVTFQYWLPSTNPNSDVAGTWESFPTGVNFVPTTIVAGKEYVYELNADWTRFADQLYASNPELNSTNFDYTNFKVRATVDAETVTSEVNGLENARQVLSLNYAGSPLNTFDTTSPVISDNIERYYNNAGVEQGYIVSFNEPVKVPDLDVADTPSVQQGNSIPAVVVEFRGTDANGNTKVFGGEVRGYAPDHPAIDRPATSADNALLVRAVGTDLQNLVDTQGYSSDWTVVIRNVTDDVGNAAATGIQKGFTIAPTPAPAEVFTAFNEVHNGVDFGTNTITLDFSSAVQFTGTTGNALDLANYTVNGTALPVGSSVALTRDLVQSSPIDRVGPEGDLSIVTITVPAGTLNAANNVINISKELTSANGVKISGKTEITQDLANVTP